MHIVEVEPEPGPPADLDATLCRVGCIGVIL